MSEASPSATVHIGDGCKPRLIHTVSKISMVFGVLRDRHRILHMNAPVFSIEVFNGCDEDRLCIYLRGMLTTIHERLESVDGHVI